MTNIAAVKRLSKKSRHVRIRRKLAGTAARPRLCVFRSLKNIYAQLIDDAEGKTLLSVSSLNAALRNHTGSKLEEAKAVGELLGRNAIEKGITEVVFDRAGYKYHGRVKALAESAREAGLKF